MHNLPMGKTLFYNLTVLEFNSITDSEVKRGVVQLMYSGMDLL